MSSFMTISEAAEFLNVSQFTMRRIITKQNLTIEPNPVDSREKLLNRSEIEKLKNGSKIKPKSSGRFVPTPDERSMLLEALADEEVEDAEGSVITLEDIESMVLTMIENRRKVAPAKSRGK